MKARGDDIGEIIRLIKTTHSDVTTEQLRVKHPGSDDDGLWFFKRPGKSIEVQLESSSGNCPFLVETDRDNTRIEVASVPDAVAVLEKLLT